MRRLPHKLDHSFRRLLFAIGNAYNRTARRRPARERGQRGPIVERLRVSTNHPIPTTPAHRFVAYDPQMPFDPPSYAARLPPSAMTRGMFFHTVEDALKSKGVEPLNGNWVAFKRYPLSEYHAALLEGAARMCPGEPLAQGLFEIGRFVYPNFAESLVGRAIFAVVGTDVQRLLRLAPRGYAAANSIGECVVHSTEKTEGHWSLVDLWDFHPFSIGISRGALDAVGARQIDLRYVAHAPEHIEFRATWEVPEGASGPHQKMPSYFDQHQEKR